jgi:hypothetical protein
VRAHSVQYLHHWPVSCVPDWHDARTNWQLADNTHPPLPLHAQKQEDTNSHSHIVSVQDKREEEGHNLRALLCATDPLQTKHLLNHGHQDVSRVVG